LSVAANAAVASVSRPVISPLVEAEFASLLSLKVRTAAMNRADASTVLAQFRLHVSNGLYHFVETGPTEFALARDWLARFTTPLRTLDSLHLATAFAHGEEMLTTDKLLARGARQVGVKCRLVR